MAASIEQYLLMKLAEELAEAGQAAAKSARFGLTNQFGSRPSNSEKLRDELEDMLVAYDCLRDMGCVPEISPHVSRAEARGHKRQRLLYYYGLSVQMGLVRPGLERLLGTKLPEEAPVPPCVLGVHCSHHGYVHGSEAEELRKRLEGLIQSGDSVPTSKLQWVLDTVDARDSAAYVRLNKAEDPWYGDES